MSIANKLHFLSCSEELEKRQTVENYKSKDTVSGKMSWGRVQLLLSRRSLKQLQ
jgi:hypothetical protein